MVKNHLRIAGDIRDAGRILGLGRSLGGRAWLGKFSCLENLIDSGAWQATVHGVTKSHEQLKGLSPHAQTY